MSTDHRTEAPADLRGALRQATAEQHRRLDHAPDQRALLEPALTVERYASIMAKHRCALAVVEAALAALEPARPSDVPPYRPRLPALDVDLATLDAPWQVPDHAASASIGDPEPCLDGAEARGRYLGTRYVLDGSTQGAAMIAKRLQQTLPGLGAHAFSYWRLQAEEAPTWQALTRSLAAEAAAGPTACSAIAAARDAFGAFLSVFECVESTSSSPELTHYGRRP